MADPRPLERRLGALAQVTDPSRLLECHQTARQQRFQHLVRWSVLPRKDMADSSH